MGVLVLLKFPFFSCSFQLTYTGYYINGFIAGILLRTCTSEMLRDLLNTSHHVLHFDNSGLVLVWLPECCIVVKANISKVTLQFFSALTMAICGH
jgi:hypothetical protein